MNLSAIFSKTGKGVQEASGKTSHLSRGDRAVLSAVDGKTSLGEVQRKFDKLAEPKFEALIQQLDKDGFIREVSSGSAQLAAAPVGRTAAPPPRKAPPAGGDDEGLDFTQALKLPPKAPPPAATKPPPVDLAAASRAEAERKAKEQQALDYKARQEAELKAKAAAEMKARAEAELKARAAAEAKARAEAEAKARAEADSKALAEADAKVKAAREAAIRMATEVKAKAEAEGKAKVDAAAKREREALEKARKESEDKARLEADLKGKLEEERRAREDAERRASEAADRAREEMEEKARRDAEELRQRLEAEMKAKLEEERKAREEEDRKRREEEDRKRAEEDRKRREEDERRRKEDEARRAQEDAERRTKEEAERGAKEAAERRAKEEAEQRVREEEERQKQQEAERKRNANEVLAAKEAERKAATAKGAGKNDDDIGVTDDDLDMDDVKRDEKALSATARKVAREREQAPVAAAAAREPMKWGKPAMIALFVLLIGGLGALQVMPVSTAEYEKAASDAMGVPVKIASARLSVITGIEVRFEDVSIGAVKIRQVRGFPELGSLFGAKKSFSRMELEGVSLSQSQLADAVLGKAAGEKFRVGRIVIKQAKLDGPLTLPALDVDAVVSGDGSLQSVSLRDGDKLSVQLSPKGNDIGFEISAGSLALPFVPALNLSDFGMKGTANRGGVTMSEFDGRAFDGKISGSAKIRWGANWLVDGEVRARGVKVAVIAPALVSEGKVDGRGAYTMSGPNPATLFENARLQGEFKIEKGVLGSFDLTRALQTGGAQTGGRTIFTELTGQAVYDKGAVKVSNVAIVAGAMNAGASLDIGANGALSGRIVAEVKTPNQTLRATLNVSGKIQDPVIRK